MPFPARRSNPDRVRQIATLVILLATFVVNTATNFAPIGGQTVGQLANSLLSPVQVIPANYAFSIWGLIYLGLLAYGIYQLAPAKRQNPTLRTIDYWLIGAVLIQIVWIFLFQLKLFWLSVLAMLGILIPLMVIYTVLHEGRERVSRQAFWSVYLPFSIYLAWISVATIVNIACALFISGWNGFGLDGGIWTAIVMTVGAAIAATLTVRYKDVAFVAVILWAYVAIGVGQASNAVIVTASSILSLVLIGLMLYAWFNRRSTLRFK